MENRKSPRLYMMAHTIDLTSREGVRQRRESTLRDFERRSEPRPNYRGPERREQGTVTAEDDKFIQVRHRAVGQPETLVRLPKWKLAALEEELAIKNTSTLGRLIQSGKFRAGDRAVLVTLLRQRGHMVLGEFVLYARGAGAPAQAAAA